MKHARWLAHSISGALALLTVASVPVPAFAAVANHEKRVEFPQIVRMAMSQFNATARAGSQAPTIFPVAASGSVDEYYQTQASMGPIQGVPGFESGYFVQLSSSIAPLADFRGAHFMTVADASNAFTPMVERIVAGSVGSVNVGFKSSGATTPVTSTRVTAQLSSVSLGSGHTGSLAVSRTSNTSDIRWSEGRWNIQVEHVGGTASETGIARSITAYLQTHFLPVPLYKGAIVVRTGSHGIEATVVWQRGDEVYGIDVFPSAKDSVTTALGMVISMRPYSSSANTTGLSLPQASTASSTTPDQGQVAGSLQSLHMLTAQDGWAFDIVGNQVQLIRTVDGGHQWEVIQTPSVQVGSIVGHLFAGPGSAWIAEQSQRPGNSPLVYFLRTQNGGRSWETVGHLTLPQTMPIQSVQLDPISSTAGFVMVEPQHGMSGEPGLLYAMGRSGTQFTLVGNNLFPTVHSSSRMNRLPDGGWIHFTSPQIGWLVAADCTTCPRHLYETVDGGTTWSSVVLPVPHSDYGRTPNPVSAPFAPHTGGALYLAAPLQGQKGLNPSELYSYGSAPADSAAHLWRVDGVLPSHTGPIQLTASRPNYIDFVSATDGYALGTQHLFKTQNGGRTWSVFSGALPKPAASASLAGIDFVNAQTGWILWYTYPLNGKVTSVLYKTVDGGRAWERVLSTRPAPLF